MGGAGRRREEVGGGMRRSRRRRQEVRGDWSWQKEVEVVVGMRRKEEVGTGEGE